MTSQGVEQKKKKKFKQMVIGGLAVVAFMVGSFYGGMYFSKSEAASQSASSTFQSDVQWAKQVGLISDAQLTYQQPLQSEFIQMVMTEFGDTAAKKVEIRSKGN